MITSKVIRQSFKNLQGDYLEAARDWYKSSDGILGYKKDCEDPLMPGAQIALRDGVNWPPPFIYIGSQSTTAQIVGHAAIPGILNTFEVQDPSFDQGIQGIYSEVAWTHKPVFDLVKGFYNHPNGERTWVIYDRFVVPSMSLSGRWQTFSVFCKFRNTFRVIG